MRDKAVFYLNGQRKEIGAAFAGGMLADYLRTEESLPGTKIVCAEGDCGACTVLRLFPGPPRVRPILYMPINSCITPVAQLDGSSLVTVDALREEPSALPAATPHMTPPPHEREGFAPAQQSMMLCHGSQCGFCTPGFVMALTGYIEKKISAKETLPQAPAHSVQEIKNALTGNLCRCTGYQPIIEAALSIPLDRCTSVQDRFYSPAQNRDLKKVMKESLRMESSNFSFFAPKTIAAAVSYRKKYPDSVILAGGTDLGVVHNKRKNRLVRALSLHLIEDLYEIRQKKEKGRISRIRAGACVTLSALRESIKEVIPEFARFLNLFASPQIKNLATLIGNVGNASPIADTPPFLLVAETVLFVSGPKGRREIPLEKFYRGYRKTALGAGELITAIEFSVPEKTESLALYKVSQRKDLDISTVNAAFRMNWENKSIQIAMGGVAAVPLRLRETEEALQGIPINEDSLARAALVLSTEMSPLSDLRGAAAMRRVVVENLFYRFFMEHSEGNPQANSQTNVDVNEGRRSHHEFLFPR